MPHIWDWNDLADDFKDTLLVGNGGSMAVDRCFSYGSLLERARVEALITTDIQKVFDYFKTEDFELVLRMIWNTYHVNRALGIEDEVTTKAYHDVREALVRAVRSIHPPHDRVVDDLDRISSFMARFREVVSLNYDLLIYWAMLRGNEHRGPWFKDCFVHGSFDSEWERLYEPWGDAKGATLVFYPHGNLVLATGLERREFKITRTDEWQELLDRIVDEWESEGSVPLFVSEGDRTQKERAILRSEYLGTIYHRVLPACGPTVVIYGWGMGLQDTHIMRQFRRAGIKRFAVSVYTERDPDAVARECDSIERRLKGWVDGCSVSFFDSSSEGCWSN